MKLEVLGWILLCLIMAGCLDSPKMTSPTTQTATATGQIPKPYYAAEDPWLDQSVFGIERLIGPGFLKSYRTNAFDCSEMAAYLEWMLEKHGFDSKVCLASQFGEDNAPHAWVAVDVPPKRYYVEPTARNEGGFVFSIIKPLDGKYKEYSNYDGIYEDIYELSLAGPVSEFDWWIDPVLKHNLKDAHYSSNK
jgi:hypothetical protein